MNRFLLAIGFALCRSLPICSQNDVAALANQAKLDSQHSDYRAAAQDYYQLLKAGDDSPPLRSNLGMMLYLSGDAEAALTHLRVALSEDPGLVAANLFAGLSLLQIGRAQEALPLLRIAERLQPHTLVIVLALGRAYVATRNIADAKKTYQIATQLDQSSPEAWYGLGVTSRASAEQTLHRLTSNGQNLERSKSSPQAAAAQQDLTTSELALTRALKLEPDGTRARLVLGEAFRDAGQLRDSVQQYQAILERKPDFAPAYLGLANTYWKFGMSAETMAALKPLLSLSPDDPEANAIMASLLVSEKLMQQAKPFADRALAGRVDLAVAHVALAKIYLAAEEPLKALPELQAALPDDVDGSYHYLLAETLRKLGRTGEASLAFEQSRRLRGR